MLNAATKFRILYFFGRFSQGKAYTNHVLVESAATERDPRYWVVCCLGSLASVQKPSGLNFPTISSTL